MINIKPKLTYDVLIVGGGVTGAADVYVLPRFTNVRKVLMLEKYDQLATVNSHPLNNAQTSHDGSTETNYDLDHALKIRPSAIALRRYAVSKNDQTLYRKHLRMALAVTEEEVQKLEQRYLEFRPYYPDLHLAYWDELSRIEPNITKGRDCNKPICALVSTEGVIINYQRLAQHLFQDAKNINPEFDYRFNSPVIAVRREGGLYVVTTDTETFLSRVVLFAAGPYSLFFAQKLGYGLDYAILPVAGSFYDAGHWLDNKVYRMQVEGRPFAEIHGDPDILKMDHSRFGPTTKPLPLMERHHYATFWDFIKLPLASSLRGIVSLFKILWKRKLTWYVLKNILFDIPIIGKALFLKEVRQIIPTMRYCDLKLRRGAGGIRPQIVNLKTGDLEMGDASLIGDNIIFNTTPSPGASVCLGNARRDAKRIVDFLGSDYYFDEEKFWKELGEPSQTIS